MYQFLSRGSDKRPLCFTLPSLPILRHISIHFKGVAVVSAIGPDVKGILLDLDRYIRVGML